MAGATFTPVGGSLLGANVAGGILAPRSAFGSRAYATRHERPRTPGRSTAGAARGRCSACPTAGDIEDVSFPLSAGGLRAWTQSGGTAAHGQRRRLLAHPRPRCRVGVRSIVAPGSPAAWSWSVRVACARSVNGGRFVRERRRLEGRPGRERCSGQTAAGSSRFVVWGARRTVALSRNGGSSWSTRVGVPKGSDRAGRLRRSPAWLPARASMRALYATTNGGRRWRPADGDRVAGSMRSRSPTPRRGYVRSAATGVRCAAPTTAAGRGSRRSSSGPATR